MEPWLVPSMQSNVHGRAREVRPLMRHIEKAGGKNRKKKGGGEAVSEEFNLFDPELTEQSIDWFPVPNAGQLGTKRWSSAIVHRAVCKPKIPKIPKIHGAGKDRQDRCMIIIEKFFSALSSFPLLLIIII